MASADSDPKAATVTQTQCCLFAMLRERPRCSFAREADNQWLSSPETTENLDKSQGQAQVRERPVVAVLQPRTDSKMSVMMRQE